MAEGLHRQTWHHEFSLDVYVKTLTVVVCISAKAALLGQDGKLKGQLARSTHRETGREPSSTGCEETTDSRKLFPDLHTRAVKMHMWNVHVHVCTHAHMHDYTEEEQGLQAVINLSASSWRVQGDQLPHTPAPTPFPSWWSVYSNYYAK